MNEYDRNWGSEVEALLQLYIHEEQNKDSLLARSNFTVGVISAIIASLYLLSMNASAIMINIWNNRTISQSGCMILLFITFITTIVCVLLALLELVKLNFGSASLFSKAAYNYCALEVNYEKWNGCSKVDNNFINNIKISIHENGEVNRKRHERALTALRHVARGLGALILTVIFYFLLTTIK